MSKPEDAPDRARGAAGASARREHQRRRAARERRVRERHPRLGALMLALATEPTHETAWARGAQGEERVAEQLARHLRQEVRVLHDRRIPGSRANIDHLVVAASGVWVIDSKRYKGRVAVLRPIFGAAKLTIAGRDQSRLVDGLARQVAAVEAALREIAPDVPIHAALCFVEAQLPLLGDLSFRGFALLSPRRLARQINTGEAVTGVQIEAVAAELATRFPAA